MMLLEGQILSSLPFFLEVQAEKTDSGFPKTFHKRYLFAFAEYLCNCNPKMRTKHFKNYFSNVAMVRYRNWSDASTPS